MLLLEDRRFYVYIYLDPRKPGSYDYQIKGEWYHFDFEPFYIGEGHGCRLYDHIKESIKFPNSQFSSKKIRILEILNNNSTPIISFVMKHLTQVEAWVLEENLGEAIKLIEDGGYLNNGRYPKASSHGTGKISKETRKRQSFVRISKGLAKGKNNPMYGKGHRVSGDKNGMFNKKHKEESRQNMSMSKLKNSVSNGKSNGRYVDLNIQIIISLYFEGRINKEICKLYIPLANEILTATLMKGVLKVLKFPKVRQRGFYTKKYLQFISENKDKQQWYIDNYKRLEQEYFDRKFAERHPEFIEEKIS